MRNLVKYPLTLDEIEKYLEDQMNQLQNLEERPIGSMEPLILQTLLSWVKEKKEG